MPNQLPQTFDLKKQVQNGLLEVMSFDEQVMYFNPQTKPVTYPGIEVGRYIITEYGRVIDTYTNHMVPTYMNSAKYKMVSLQKEENSSLHQIVGVGRLVAYEFCPNVNINQTVDHLDKNKLNDHYKNLQWVDLGENIRRSYYQANGRKPKPKYNVPYDDSRDIYKSTKIPIEILHKICQLLQNTDLNYKQICYDVGLPNMKWWQARNICGGLIYDGYHHDIAKQYDFSKRILKKSTIYTSDQYKQLQSLISKGLTYKEIYEQFYGTPWKDADRYKQDSFRHLVLRCGRKVYGSSTIPVKRVGTAFPNAS